VPGDEIRPADLSFLIPRVSTERPAADPPIERLLEARDDWERTYILQALDRCGGNISRTADVLGLERSNLYKKMRGLGIAPAREREEA